MVFVILSRPEDGKRRFLWIANGSNGAVTPYHTIGVPLRQECSTFLSKLRHSLPVLRTVANQLNVACHYNGLLTHYLVIQMLVYPPLNPEKDSCCVIEVEAF